ncbi:MAG: Putative DNA-binding protein, partial [uncultured Nocardioides sp.]
GTAGVGRGGVGGLEGRGEHDREGARGVPGHRGVPVGGRQGRRRGRVHRAQVGEADRGDPAQQEGGAGRRRRRAHAQGRRLRAPAPGAAPLGRRHRLCVALLADELGPRPAEV